MTAGTPSATDRHRTFLINILYTLVILTITFLVIRYLILWTLPFVFAFIVAALLQHPLRWLVKKTGGNRKFFSILLVILLVLVLAGIVVAVGWQTVTGVWDFLSDGVRLSEFESEIRNLSVQLQDSLTSFLGRFSSDSVGLANEAIESFTNTLVETLSGWVTSLATGILSFTTTRLPSLLIGFLFWIIASVFLSIDYQSVTAFLLRQVPDRFTPVLNATRDIFKNTLLKLIRAYALIMLITFVELSIGLYILQVSHVLWLAALIAVVDILPVLGTGTVIIPWAFVALLTGRTFLGIGLAVLYIIITVLRNILEPHIVSRQIGLNPLVTLFFMYLGLKSCGILGMLLFPVAIIILKELQDAGHIHLWKQPSPAADT